MRYIRIAVAAVTLTVLSAILGLILFTRTARFNRLVQARLAPYLATTFRGQLVVGAVQGSIWGDLVLRDIKLRYEGAEIVRVPSATIGYSLIPLLWRSIHLKVDVENPVVALVRDRSGGWNLLDALASSHPAPTSGPPNFTFVFDAITLRDAALTIAPAGAEGPRYSLSTLQFAGAIAIGPSSTDAVVRALEANVAVPGFPQIHAEAALAYAAGRTDQKIELSLLELRTAESTISVVGSASGLQEPFIDGTVTIRPLSGADLAKVVPALALKPDLNGTIRLRGPESALHTTFQITADEARLSGDAQIDLSGHEPIYSTTLKIDHAKLDQITKRSGFAGLLVADFRARGNGLSVAAAEADANLRGRNLVLNRYVLGDSQITARLSQNNLRAIGTVSGPGGDLNLNGSALLTGGPSYKFDLTARRLDFARIGIPVGVPAQLNFDASVDGSGLSLTSINTGVIANLSKSQLAGASINRGTVDMRVVRGQAQFARASFLVEGAALDLKGVGGLIPGQASNLSYSVKSSSVAPLLKLGQMTGDGQLNVKGIVTGPYDRLRTRGLITGAGIQTAGYAIRTADVHYDISAAGPGLPTGTLDARFNELRVGVALRTLSIRAKAALPSHPIAIAIDAQDEQRRLDHLVLALDYRPPLIGAHISEGTFELADGAWRLTAPADVRASAGRVTISRLRMHNGSRELIAEGLIARNGAQNLTLTANDLDLAAVSMLIPGSQRIDGTLTASLRVAGTAEAPAIETHVNATKVAAEGNGIGDLTSSVIYRDRRATLEANLRDPNDNRLVATGTLPMTINWTQGVRIQFADGMDIRINSPRLDLTRFATLAQGTVSGLQGVGAIDLHLQGSPSRPIPSGNLRLAGIQGRIVPIGVSISEAHARVDLYPQQIKISSFSAHSGDGSISASGAIALHEYAPGAANIRITLDQWPAIATTRYQATIAGEIAATGSLDRPRLDGKIEVLNGRLRPDPTFLTSTSDLAPDETITVIAQGPHTGPLLPSDQKPSPQMHAAPPLFDRLALRLDLQIHRDTWIKHEQITAELEGRLLISKAPGAAIQIVGTIRTVHGWIIYQQRRFDLQSGEITFTGAKTIDPSLNIDAQYTLPDYVVDIILGGTANHPTLQLKSQPDLPQADILSLILFGKTSSALGQGEQQNLQQHAIQMAGGYAAGQIGSAISQSLGLEDLGFQLSGTNASGRAVGFGRYVGRNTYVSASESVGGTQGRKVSLQYFLLRWLSVTSSTSSSGGSEIDLNLRKSY